MSLATNTGLKVLKTHAMKLAEEAKSSSDVEVNIRNFKYYCQHCQREFDYEGRWCPHNPELRLKTPRRGFMAQEVTKIFFNKLIVEELSLMELEEQEDGLQC